MDLYSLTLGCVFFLLALFFGYSFLLKKHDLNRVGIMHLVGYSALGHFLGGIAYYWMAVNSGADSKFYFDNATMHYEGTGYYFSFFILGYLRWYIIGDSFLAAFLFFAALGFLGSLFYLSTFKILLDKLTDNYNYFLIDPKILLLPACLLLCWPSYFFWSAGLVKDCFAFLSIGIFLYFFANPNFSISNLLLLIIGCLNGFLIRPYLFIIAVAAASIFILFGSKWNLAVKIIFLVLISYGVLLMMPQLINFVSAVHYAGTFSNLGQYAVTQQRYMNIGSHVPMPTHNPQLMFFFLPYLILANLILPLLIGATNLIGLISSIENAYLFYWLIFFLKNWSLWQQVSSQIKVTRFFMIFFIFGMACLSMMNTNLGLAMREKMMYVPAFLIVVFLIYAYKKILHLEYIAALQEAEQQLTFDLASQRE